MGSSQRTRKARRGSVMMETVIVMPILLFLIFLLIQFAHVWTAKQMVSYAAFCAARAIMVVPPADQQAAAENAAKMALSWMCLADDSGDAGEGSDEEEEVADKKVTVPGWGEIFGARSRDERVSVEIVEVDGKKLDGSDNDYPVAAVKITFRFPLMISAMAVNKVLGTAASASPASMDGDEYGFYSNLDRMAGNPTTIGGWPYASLSETCVLPMPYSTEKFPTDGFAGCSLDN